MSLNDLLDNVVLIILSRDWGPFISCYVNILVLHILNISRPWTRM